MIMGRHDGEEYPRSIRPMITVFGLLIVAVLAGLGLALVPDGQTHATAVPATPAAPTSSSVGHENHIATAMSTPAGQVAQHHSDQVTHDRQVAAGDPIARARQ